jgi:hypothetical protein
MSKIINDETISTEKAIANTQLTVAKTEDKIFNFMEHKTNNNKIIAVLFVAFLINLVLTISIAGAFVVMNDNAAQADEYNSSLQAQVDEHEETLGAVK